MIAGQQTWRGWLRVRARRETRPGQRTEVWHGGDERADRWARIVGEHPRASGAEADREAGPRAGGGVARARGV